MADIEEKLIELLESVPHAQRLYPDLYVTHLITNGVTVQEWLSAKESPPKVTGKYLVAYYDYGHWTIRDMWFITEYQGYALKRGKPCWVVYDSEYGDIDYTRIVTHWMPLPEPPTVDKKS